VFRGLAGQVDDRVEPNTSHGVLVEGGKRSVDKSWLSVGSEARHSVVRSAQLVFVTSPIATDVGRYVTLESE
jgi:hypothetical protein